MCAAGARNRNAIDDLETPDSLADDIRSLRNMDQWVSVCEENAKDFVPAQTHAAFRKLWEV
jgi:uncharacterized membrane protein